MSHHKIEEYLSQLKNGKKSNKEKIFSENQITLDEIRKAVINLKTIKHLGVDGLTPEFYKVFL